MKTNLALNNQLKNKIIELSASDNSPFYLYDTERIQQNCQKLLDIPYSPKSIHFAMMANSTPQFKAV